MNLLEVAQNVCSIVDIVQPETLTGSSADQILQMKAIMQQAGDELATVNEWRKMIKKADFTGDGSNVLHALPSNFKRFVDGNPVRYTVAPYTAFRGCASTDEWSAIQASKSTKLILFRLNGSNLELSKAIESGFTFSMYYVSKNWLINGSTESETIAQDTDETLFPSRLLLLSTIARWKRQKGLPYQDEDAEFTASLNNEAMFDQGIRSPANGG